MLNAWRSDVSGRIVARLLVAAALLWPTLGPAADLAITGARILTAPDEPALERGTVLVRDGRIVAVGAAEAVDVPRGIETLDASGLTLTAGFWNSHVHLLADAFVDAARRPAATLAIELQAMFTRWGFTTVFDISSQLADTAALRQRIDAGEVEGPRILTTGNPIFPANGTPIYVRELWKRRAWANDEVETPELARAKVAAQLRRGADGVKVFTGAIVGPPQGVLPMPIAIARAAVEPALAAGKPAFAHPTTPLGIRIALDAGVTVLAHTTPTEGQWPAELVAELARRRVALVPTLTLLEVALAEDRVPRPVVERMMGDAQQQVRALAAAGGEILFGTDVGFIAQADTTRELQLMAGAGLDHRAILRALTTAPAARFGAGARAGRVALGAEADLVLLGADPARGVEAFADVRYTIRAGRIVYRAPR